jgi:hypothetical protein
MSDSGTASGENADGMQSDDGNDQEVDEGWYRDRRKYLVEGAQYHSRALDNHILTLAAGILAFSAVFLPTRTESVTWCGGAILFLAWMLLLAAIVCTLSSLWLGRKDYEWEIGHLDRQYLAGRIQTPSAKWRFRWLVSLQTSASLWLFCLGLLLLCVFGAIRIFTPLPKG